MLPLQAHFYLAYFGWIGLTILGAQLQFFKAITGLRKYTPQYLRYLYHIFLLFGLFLLVYASYYRKNEYVTFGFLFYLVGVLIHTYWVVKQSGSKYFKFPLDYMFISNLYLIIALTIFFLSSSANEYYIVNLNILRHILSIGWISLTLQGALIRILPMFVGKSIDRKSRSNLKYHFVYASFSSTFFILAFISENDFFIVITGILWFASWVWTLLILKRSIVRNNLQYKQTLFFFVPGMIWFLIGVILGFYFSVQDRFNFDVNLRALHIHLSLLLGISLIMLGALHRITTFQIYTLLYTGKRNTSITLRHLLRLNRLAISAVLYNISIVYMAYGFVDNNFDHVGKGGILIVISTGMYSTIIIQNIYHYLVHKKSAIPFWLKSTENTVD